MPDRVPISPVNKMLFWSSMCNKEREGQRQAVHKHHSGAFEDFRHAHLPDFQEDPPSAAELRAKPLHLRPIAAERRPDGVFDSLGGAVGAATKSHLGTQLFGLRELDPPATSTPIEVRRSYTSAEQFRADAAFRQSFCKTNNKLKYGKPLTSAQEVGWHAIHRGSTPSSERRSVAPRFTWPGPPRIRSPRPAETPEDNDNNGERWGYYPLKGSAITVWDTQMRVQDLYSMRERKSLGKSNQPPLKFSATQGIRRFN